MATKRMKSKAPYATQLDIELLAQWRAYVEARGETLLEATERAFRRDMAYPPPPKAPPPPPVVAPLPDAAPAKKAGKKAK